MANLTGDGLALYGTNKKGTPYFYGSKMAILTEQFMQQMHSLYPSVVSNNYIKKARTKEIVGKVCVDCSGLISSYTKKILGSSQLYSQAYTRLPISQWKDFAVGVVLWKSGHVGIYLGNGLVAEAKGIDYGVVITDIASQKWQYGLTFSWMTYSYKNNIEDKSWKGTNPYTEPTIKLKKGSQGEGVKWLQWELNEAGYTLDIDGDFGKKTLEVLKNFQQSSKIQVDGICGSETRKALIGNTGSKKSNEEIAKEVLNGKWGNNPDRKRKLEAAGYDYEVIRKLVNQMLK